MLAFSLCCGFIFVVETFASITLNIESPDLCSPITKRKLVLGRTNDSSLVVTQNLLNVHAYDWEKNLFCKFQVISKYSDGIFSVIQKLNLRQDTLTGECIDYVQFERKHEVRSRKFCGNINARVDMDLDSQGVALAYHAKNAFIDTDGVTDVRIFVDKKSIDIFEKPELKIVFTTYRDNCYTTNTDVPCSKTNRHCIYSLLLNDNDVNCPFYGCVDEEDCSEKVVILAPKSIGNKVLIASISSLLLIFGIFICCILVCKMHRIFCWADHFARNQENTEPNETCIELNETPPSQVLSQETPSAPPVVEEDKDLPPSYHSLFPER